MEANYTEILTQIYDELCLLYGAVVALTVYVYGIFFWKVLDHARRKVKKNV